MARSQTQQQSLAANHRVDDYLEGAAAFAQPILNGLREVVHTAVPEVEETIKWSMPFFLYKGIILANMAAFKTHCSFRIWSLGLGTATKDDVHIPREKPGVFDKLTTLHDLPSRKELKSLLVEAAFRIDRGERTKNWERPAKKARPEAFVPEALQRGLNANVTAAEQFAAMSRSCRRDYCEWIGEAKREETRARRVAEAIAMIAAGKNRHWKYEPPR